MDYGEALSLVSLGGGYLIVAVIFLNTGRITAALTKPSADDSAARVRAEAAAEESRALRARATEQTREYREVVDRLQAAIDQLVATTKEFENR